MLSCEELHRTVSTAAEQIKLDACAVVHAALGLAGSLVSMSVHCRAQKILSLGSVWHYDIMAGQTRQPPRVCCVLPGHAHGNSFAAAAYDCCLGSITISW